MEPSSAYVEKYFQAAEEALEEASVLAERGLLMGAVNRAYYAMFYAASAVLHSEQVRLPKTHKTIINLFHQHFVQSGRLSGSVHRDLVRAFQLRQRVDYEISFALEADVVRDMVQSARAFLGETKKMV